MNAFGRRLRHCSKALSHAAALATLAAPLPATAEGTPAGPWNCIYPRYARDELRRIYLERLSPQRVIDEYAARLKKGLSPEFYERLELAISNVEHCDRKLNGLCTNRDSSFTHEKAYDLAYNMVINAVAFLERRGVNAFLARIDVAHMDWQCDHLWDARPTRP
jgi:hypothetical protein